MAPASFEKSLGRGLLILPIAIGLITGQPPPSGAAGPQGQATLRPPGSSQSQTAVLAGGCFWGMEAVFEHVKGVSEVVSGYAGGAGTTARYELVGSGDTGHAEAVRIRFDPRQVSYNQLLEIYFSVAHDPTELNRQGPDVGTQYRSAIFVTSPGQKNIALASMKKVNQSHALRRPIVTQVVPLKGFYPAEPHHQDFIARHPTYPYVVVNDLPKLAQLKLRFPKLYKQP